MTDFGEVLMHCADAFQRAWTENPPVSLTQFLQQNAGSLPQEAAGENCAADALSAAALRRRLLRTLIPIDLHFRREEEGALSPSANTEEETAGISTAGKGSSPAVGRYVEDYLDDFPELRTDSETLRELMAAEFRVRRRCGETPQPEEFVRRLEALGQHPPDSLQRFRESLEMESSIHNLFAEDSLPARFEKDDACTHLLLPDAAVAIGAAAADASSLKEPGAKESGDDFPARAAVKDKDREGEPQTAVAAARLEAFLAQTAPFSQLSSFVRAAVAEEAKSECFRAGDVLLREGDPADCLLILLEGTVDVSIQSGGKRQVIARVRAPSVMGEIGLVTREPRSATVTALAEGQAAILSRENYERIAGRYPRLSIAIAELIAERIGTQVVDVLCGKTIGSYRLQYRLGSGGMGIVYRAEETDTQRPVALKMLRHDLTLDCRATERFHREAAVVGSLRHPNIVQVYEEFPAYGTCFLAMEYCDGPNLAEFIAAQGPLPLAVTKQLLGQLASALLHAHQSGVVHRDLKPGNVILHRDGCLKLVDFGLARSFAQPEAGLTVYGQIMGTPRYMAPEQLMGARGDEKSDLFALGCLTCEMLTGRPLFRSRRIEDLLQERAGWEMPARQEIRDDLDEELFDIVCGCLQPSPAERQVNLEAIVSWGRPLAESLLTVVRPRAEALLAHYRSNAGDATVCE